MTDYTPEQWAQIARNAQALLQRDPTNARARAAFNAARPHLAAQREALNAADVAGAAPSAAATLGLGAADMMSFGLGPQIARRLDPSVGAVQQAAQAAHPTAHLVGEGLGLLGPAGVEVGLTKAGKLAPTAIRAAVSGIKNRVVRAAAKTTLNAATGAGYAAAQAAGRTEGGLAARGKAALGAAPYGAAAGAALPVTAALLTQAIRPVTRYAGRVVGQIAGKAAPVAERQAVPAVQGLLGVGEELGAVAPRGTLLEPRAPSMAPRGMQSTTPDLLDVPTFQRRGPNTPRPGHPLFSGEAAPTRSAEVRGGEPLLPKANPQIAPLMQEIRDMSTRDLVEAWKNAPTINQKLRGFLLVELQRRRITVPDLGIRPGLLGG